ncbi:inositol oxygenase [Kwoniella mangroviensis CBS 10435]|uniref:Inositol oxygenase n=1 Tax=Kwoniella mangroviensis CBS 10435 TaxID=1331196 RepID=A0A1B9IXS2_9TREE|nr:inositol oxygenase [Kwoniella mangroviensis CBS 8507]OCF60330.1 inositol oxygenase [Kwoniella mangroviensis CBS 10435]OCF69297.1 inositol oxygenase [Kwoniella mangroviensis CBS 8507]OCF72496.1 inositol oxygenase [Kwoniella mangroviensis CBS 8886]
MVHAPEITDYIKTRAKAMDEVSDQIDEVNLLKLKQNAKAQTEKSQQDDNDFEGDSKFDSEKDKSVFRQYENACDRVKNFYAEQHTKQTLKYNLRMRKEFRETTRARMGVWEALELLNTLVDESDPDTSVPQIVHALQAAEAARKDGKPEWMQLTCLIHDLGKLLCFFGADGQWDVVGDTFVVGCKYVDEIIYGPESFKENPDYYNEKLQTDLGIYEEHCGLENVMISFGHDEYLYHICKTQSNLPKEGLWMIRYHSFYPWHRAGSNAYRHLMVEEDEQALKAVRAFNPYDLYSKSDAPPNVDELKEYYQCLIKKYFPEEIEW